jgi:hypothetical protein
MAYVNKKREKGWHYLVSYAALNQQADYRAWQYDEFLGVFLLVCQNAALQPQQTKSPDTSKLDLARMELDETEKQIARLLDFLMRGTGAAVENRLRELEAKKLELEKSINDFESETLAKPADVSKVDWKDRAALRENLRATVKRISVDAAKKSFRAQFLDGREYAFSVEGKQATIQLPDGESIPIVM